MKTVKTDLYYYQFIRKNPKFTGCVIDKNGSKYWLLNGKYHRTDGPAIEFAKGNKFWYLNGKKHRTDGPAVEFAGGSKLWYLNGECLTEEEWTYTVRLNKLGEFLNGS